MRAMSAPKSHDPLSDTSCSGSGEASTNRHLPASSHAAMSQPSEMRLRRRSVGVSSNVMNTPASSYSRIPPARYCEQNSVLADPAEPATSVVRASGRPPWAMASKPGIPVGTLLTGAIVMREPSARTGEESARVSRGARSPRGILGDC
jgi:hypothetical protein